MRLFKFRLFLFTVSVLSSFLILCGLPTQKTKIVNYFELVTMKEQAFLLLLSKKEGFAIINAPSDDTVLNASPLVENWN